MTKGYKSLNSFFSKSNFIGSYIDFQQIPNFNLPEICFLGRSNVGKSSLINQLTKNKKLAKTSKTPGRTQSINLFSINDKIMFVDLPGYGFAKFSKNLKNQLYKSIEEYINKRSELKQILLLIDGKVGMKQGDFETISFLSQVDVPFIIILTKIDKCSRKILDENYNKISEHLKNSSKKTFEIYATSSSSNEGIAELQKNIYKFIKNDF